MHAPPYEGALADRERQSREERAVPLTNVYRHKESGSENRSKGTCFLRELGLESEVWAALTVVREGLLAVHLQLFGGIWPGTFLIGPRRCRITWEKGKGKTWMSPCCTGACNMEGAWLSPGNEWPLEERKGGTGEAPLQSAGARRRWCSVWKGLLLLLC